MQVRMVLPKEQGTMIRFRDRRDAGKKLARELLPYNSHPDVLVSHLFKEPGTQDG